MIEFQTFAAAETDGVAPPAAWNYKMNKIEGKNYVLYHGDCLSVIQDIPDDCVLISDPPYGCGNDCDYTRFSGGLSESNNFGTQIIGDNQPFDPTPFLNFERSTLWGYQFYADKLPQGTVLVWVKKRDNQIGTFLSDAELAWERGGKGVYVFNHVWHGFDRETERGKTLHPTQKPVDLMAWCVERISEPGDTIFDPYMGSGSTAIAALRLDRHFIGCEIDEKYFEIARRRIENDMALFRDLKD